MRIHARQYLKVRVLASTVFTAGAFNCYELRLFSRKPFCTIGGCCFRRILLHSLCFSPLQILFDGGPTVLPFELSEASYLKGPGSREHSGLRCKIPLQALYL